MAHKLISYEMRRLKLISDYVKGDNVLDIGFSKFPNPFLRCFNTAGLDLIIDRDIDNIYTEQIQGDISYINDILLDRKFDTIVCGELIEHLENPYKVIRSLKKHLNANGRLIVTTPNIVAFPVLIIELFNIEKYFYSNEHKYLLSPRWIAKMMRDCGYKVIKIKPVGLWFYKFYVPFTFTTTSWQNIFVCENEVTT